MSYNNMVSFHPALNDMHKELLQPTETKAKFSNSAAFQNTRKVWELIRRNSLITAAGIVAAGCTGVGCATAENQIQDSSKNPIPHTLTPKQTPEDTSPWKIIPSKPTEIHPTRSPTEIPQPKSTVTPKTETPQEEKPKFSVRHLNSGDTVDFESNVIVAGDVSINGKRFYDDDPETGLIVNLPEGGNIIAPFGADVLIPISQKGTNEIIEQKKQEMIENGCGSKCTKGVNVLTITKADTTDQTPPPPPAPSEVKKTYLMPGESLYWPQTIEVQSGEIEKKALHVPTVGGNRDYVNFEFRISTDPQKIYHEGNLIEFRNGNTIVTVIMTPKLGAGNYENSNDYETCFEEIDFNTYSRGTNWTDKPITRTVLAQKVCFPKTLEAIFGNHRVQGQTVRTTFVMINIGPYDQRAGARINQDKCYPYSDRKFRDSDGETSLEKVRTIPGNGGRVAIDMITTLPANTNTDALTCSAIIQPVVENRKESP